MGNSQTELTINNKDIKNQTLIVLKKFVCCPNNRLLALRVLSFWESTVASCSHFFIKSYYIKFYFFSPGFYFEIYSQCWRSRFPTQNNQWNFCAVEQKATLTLELWQIYIFLILMWNKFTICRIMQLIFRNRSYENFHYIGLCN